MKVVLDVETNSINPKENDILIFKDGKWKAISKESFLAGINNELAHLNEFTIDAIKKDIKDLEEDLGRLAKLVKEK